MQHINMVGLQNRYYVSAPKFQRNFQQTSNMANESQVTIHQLLEGSCPDNQLSALCGVISDIIMQAFSLHR